MLTAAWSKTVADRNWFAVAAVYGLALAALGIVRHNNYWSGAFDLGIFDQAVWLLARGQAHVTIIDKHILADHMSPILLVFAPIYMVFAHPGVLLAAQAVALAATIFPMRRLGMLYGLDSRLTVSLFMASTPVLAAATFDFHAYTLATPGVAWVLVAAKEGNGRTAILAAAYVLLCRADLLLILVVAAALSPRNVRVRLLAVCVPGLVLLALPPYSGPGAIG